MSNHAADIQNRNKGTSGTNKTLDHNQGNRGWQKQEAAKKVPPSKKK